MYYDEFLKKGEIIINIPKKEINKGHRVICLETKEVFDSIKSASIKYKIESANIGACCRDKRTTAGEYHWMYYEDYLSGKKIKISYGKSAQGKELQALADKNCRVVLDNAKLSKMSKIN